MKLDVLKYSKSITINYGLYDGKIGLCMGYFIYARERKEPDYAIKAKGILHDVIDHIDKLDAYSLNKGLIGFGWAIEWMYKHDFIRIGTNEFLEDLDDEVYKLVVYNTPKSIDFEDGIFAIMLYLYTRICSKSRGQNFYRNICNCECLSILVDRLYQAYGDKAVFGESTQLNQELISNALILLSKIFLLRINLDRVTSIISMIVDSEQFKIYYLELKGASCLNSDFLHSLEAAVSLIYGRDYLSNLKNSAVKTNGLQKIATMDSEKGIHSVFFFLDSLDAENKYKWKEAWLYRLEKL